MSEGKKLKALRVKLQLTQKDLANLIGMESWIPAWEQGRCSPPPFVWAAMARLEAQRKAQKRTKAIR